MNAAKPIMYSIVLAAIILISSSSIAQASGSQATSIIANSKIPPPITPTVTGGIAPAPSPYGWMLATTDPDEGGTPDLKAVYYKVENGLLYFKIEYYRNYTNSSLDIDTGIFLDIDMNASTGLDVDFYPNANNTGVGAEYIIIVGYEAWEVSGVPAIIVKFDGTWNLIGPTDYYDVPDTGNTVIVGVYINNLTDPPQQIAAVVGDIPSGWDWAPDTGHVTLYLVATSVGGLISQDTAGAEAMAAIPLIAPTLLSIITLVLNRYHKNNR